VPRRISLFHALIAARSASSAKRGSLNIREASAYSIANPAAPLHHPSRNVDPPH